MKLRHYKVLSNKYVEELIPAVNSHLEAGWTLVGGIVISQYGAAQSIAWDVSADNEYGITPPKPIVINVAGEPQNVGKIALIDYANPDTDTTVVSLSTADVAPLTSKKARGRPKSK